MKKFDLIFDKKMLEFTINNLIKNTSFAINEIKIVKIAFNELLVFVIEINEYNNVIFLDYEQTTLFIYNIINNQIEINCIRFIKHINLNINYYKNIVNFIEFHQKKLNEIRFRQ